MYKDSSRESSIKKKRKSASAAENEKDADIYKKAVEFEEKEALSRSGVEDAKIYFTTCKEVRQLIQDISELKAKNTPEARQKISEKTSEICVKLVLLKKLNRMEKVRHVLSKEQLNGEKQKVDSINLQYQNLLYEANHLNSEYRKCFQFKSKDEDIDLVPVEEFLLEAPENLTSKFLKFDENNETLKHELRLARLEWELQQRIHLAEMCKKLEEEKKKLELDITERKNKLDKLGPLLSKIIEASKPVQEHLSLHIDKTQAEHKLASLLPNALYLFYINIDAYRKVYDPKMSVEIIGDQDEALQFKELQVQETLSIEDEDQSDNEIESQEVEEVVEVKKRRHRKSIQVDPMEEKKRKLLHVHPLAIEIAINTKDGPSIKIKFSYCTKLEIVTVVSSVTIPENITGNAAREVLTNESVIAELVEGDFGLESPNPCTSYQLQKVGLTSFESLVPNLGYVYGWAQKICGIDFAPSNNSQLIQPAYVEMVMKTIKRRLKSRYALAKQLEDLEWNVMPKLPDSIDMPKATVSSLSKWSSSNYQAFCESKFGDALLESDFISASDIFYLAEISRNNAKLRAFVAIRNDYPASAPIFSLCLNYNGLRHAQNDDNIRDMERAVNIDWSQDIMNSTWLLSAQIISLCVALDIYLETEDPKTFQQNTIFIKSSCGRNRRKPFKFRKIGVGVFTQ